MAKKKEQPETLRDYVQRSAKAKKTTPEIWWETTVQNIGSCRLATHVGKFTHPASTAALLVEPGDPDPGYVTTQACQVPEDLVAAAQYAGAASLLMRTDEEGITLLEQIELHPGKPCKTGLPLLAERKLREAVEGLRDRSLRAPEDADRHLKQVYFPVDDGGTYHLLTVMPSSSLLLELKNRLRRMAARQYQCTSRSGTSYGGSWDSIPNQTEIGFGGTKPLNISMGNSRAGGTAYLLPSLPPAVSEGPKTRLPKKDFFAEILPRAEVRHSLRVLHGLFLRKQNNKEIRDAIRAEVDALASISVSMAAGLRMERPGWSENAEDLPAAQKIWLDSAYRDARLRTDVWIDQVGTRFGYWLAAQYERLLGTDAVDLGPEERKFFKYELVPLLKKEVRMEK